MPDADRGGVITQEIYDGYHKKIYPNIMKQVDEYILPAVYENGKIHLGLGFYIKSDNPDKDIRTLNNSLNQFWSLLTATSINEIHRRIDMALKYPNDIQVTATIYDSIYGIARINAELIKWLNDNIVEIMIKDFVVDQVVKNEAALELGTDWSNMIELPNDVTEEQISDVLKQLKEQ